MILIPQTLKFPTLLASLLLSALYAGGCSCGDDKKGAGSGGGDSGNANQECDDGTPICGCDQSCISDAAGAGTPAGFDLTDGSSDANSGVELDNNGWLKLSSEDQPSEPYIWIPSSHAGEVSKFSTRETIAEGVNKGRYKELARYVTGPHGNSNDPSRTSVNTAGAVYVGNRGGGNAGGGGRSGTPNGDVQSVTKFATDERRCKDKNGNGTIETSRDSNGDGAISDGEMLSWGADECMLWNTPLYGNGVIRAVAAQDEPQVDGGFTEYVWVGLYGNGADEPVQIVKLDGESGEVVLRFKPPVNPYGFAMDGRAQLWVVGRPQKKLLRVDTTQCRDNDSCSVAACDGVGPEQDRCTLQTILSEPAGGLYGITVDRQQHVWLGSTGPRGVYRYDHSADAGSRWTFKSTPIRTRGIAADGLGYVYAGGDAKGVFIFATKDFSSESPLVNIAPDTSSDAYAVGMAVDSDGKVWAINDQQPGFATVVEPNPKKPNPTTLDDTDFEIHPIEGANNTQLFKSAVGLDGPYCYSDMTGVQLALATGRGYYQRVLRACEGIGGQPVWDKLHWEATTPEGTSIAWYIRTASSAAGLDAEPFTLLAEVPDAQSPVEIGELGEGKAFLEVRVELLTAQPGETNKSPLVRFFEATYECQTEAQ